MASYYVWVKVESVRKYTVQAESHEEAMSLGEVGEDAEGNEFSYTEEINSMESLDSLEEDYG